MARLFHMPTAPELGQGLFRAFKSMLVFDVRPDLRGCWRADGCGCVGYQSMGCRVITLSIQPCLCPTRGDYKIGQNDGNVINQDPTRTDACSLCFAEFFNGGPCLCCC